jgi:hypothetical protein
MSRGKSLFFVFQAIAGAALGKACDAFFGCVVPRPQVQTTPHNISTSGLRKDKTRTFEIIDRSDLWDRSIRQRLLCGRNGIGHCLCWLKRLGRIGIHDGFGHLRRLCGGCGLALAIDDTYHQQPTE